MTPSLATRLATAIAALTAIGVAAPAISIVVLAFGPSDGVWSHLAAYVLPQAFRDTAVLLFGVGAVTLAIGAGTAWLMSAYEFAGRSLLLPLLPLPLAIPTYIGAYVYVDLFEPFGLAHSALTAYMPAPQAMALLPSLRSMPGAILIMSLVLYPYVYLSMRAMLHARSLDFVEAARVLGADKWTIFCRVSLPMARPALAVGLALTLLETLNDIGASEYLGIKTLTVSIFTTWLNQSSLAGAAQLSLFLLSIVALLIAMERFGRRNINIEHAAENPATAARKPLTGLRAVAAWCACATPVLLGFIVPVLFLIYTCIRRGQLTSIDPTIWRDALNTVTLAAIATIAAVTLGLIVILANRWRRTALTTTAIAISQMGYAFPGLVLALGLLTPVLGIDKSLNALATSAGLGAPGLIMVGSGAALVIAYVIRFLAVPTGFIKSGFAQIPMDYDDSALAAGAGRLRMLRRVHLPLLRPALIGAFIIVFVDCLKELPATLLLRPLNVETLATSIYQHASRGSFEDGAFAAMLIVVVSLAPVLWLTRISDVPDGPV